MDIVPCAEYQPRPPYEELQLLIEGHFTLNLLKKHLVAHNLLNNFFFLLNFKRYKKEEKTLINGYEHLFLVLQFMRMAFFFLIHLSDPPT